MVLCIAVSRWPMVCAEGSCSGSAAQLSVIRSCRLQRVTSSTLSLSTMQQCHSCHAPFATRRTLCPRVKPTSILLTGSRRIAHVELLWPRGLYLLPVATRDALCVRLKVLRQAALVVDDAHQVQSEELPHYDSKAEDVDLLIVALAPRNLLHSMQPSH